VNVKHVIPAIRAINDLFFGSLAPGSFTEPCAGATALVQGSREAMHYIRASRGGSL